MGVDSTTLEAKSAMQSIVRRDNGRDWKEYLRKLAEAEGVRIETTKTCDASLNSERRKTNRLSLTKIGGFRTPRMPAS